MSSYSHPGPRRKSKRVFTLEAVLKSSSVRRVDHYLSFNSTDTTEPRSGCFVKVVVGCGACT